MEDFLLGVEIGGTKLQLAIGNKGGEIIFHQRGVVDIKKGPDGILDWLADNIPTILNKAVQFDGKIVGIGVGFGGGIDTTRGEIIKSIQISGWEGFKLKGWFETNFKLPTKVFNDSNAACWGEYCLGVGKGTKHFFYTNIGSGIGGGLVINGEIFDGQGCGAGDLGHTYIPDWTSSNLGAEQKLENLCSGWAIESRLRQCENIPADSIILKLCNGCKEKITCKMLGEAGRMGDKFALEELDRIARDIGIALANLITLFNPECVAIGGGVSLIGNILIDRVFKNTQSREFITSKKHYRIVECQLGELVVLHGAILLAKNETIA